MSINAPRGQNAFRESIFAWAADVIHDLLSPLFDVGFSDSAGDVIKRLVPTHLFPTPPAATSCALQWMKNAIGVMNLIQRRRSFGAVASARTRMFGIAFELLNLTGSFVDVSE